MRSYATHQDQDQPLPPTRKPHTEWDLARLETLKSEQKEKAVAKRQHYLEEKLWKEYYRLLTWGRIWRTQGRIPTFEEWAEREKTRRKTVRGVKRRKGEEIEVVGQRVYLPNIVFRLQPSMNPYEAIFRTPQSITKTDVRSYLWAVYGLPVTYVHTENIVGKMARGYQGKENVRQPHKTFKRVIVGLEEPFVYPQSQLYRDILMRRDPERLARDSEERETVIEQMWGIKKYKDFEKKEMLRVTRRTAAAMKWKWRGSLAASRKAILARVVRQRYNRDILLRVQREELQAFRAANPVDAVKEDAPGQA